MARQSSSVRQEDWSWVRTQGGSIDIARRVDAVVTQLGSRVKTSGLSDMTLAQACGDDINGNRTVGLGINTKGDVALVQPALQMWQVIAQS